MFEDRQITAHRRPLAAITIAVAILAVSAGPAQAVIAYGDDSPTTADPASLPAYSDFPYWFHTGLRGVGTGIYLDNGWVLTANHVGAGTVNLGGTNYLVDSSKPAVRLQNPDSSPTDLKLFKILSEPAVLPTIITTTSVSSGNNLLMTGFGRQRAATTTTWDVDPGPDPWVWTTPATNPQLPNVTGYLTEAARVLHWGDNRASSNTSLVSTGSTTFYGFESDFAISGGTAHEAAAVTGDSGGAVWRKTGGTWELTGIILAVSVLSGQPDGGSSAMLNYTDTLAADLSVYYDQIMAVIFEAPILGDFDDSGLTNLIDINAFVLAITDPVAYAAQYPQVDFLGTGDFTGNGTVNLEDIPGFVAVVAGGGGFAGGDSLYAAVPEPTTLAVLLAASAMLIRRRR